MGSYKGSYSPYPGSALIPIIHDIDFNEPLAKIAFVAEAVIDTGADFSIIPGKLISQYRLPVRDYIPVSWPDGTTKICDVYILQVGVPGLAALTEIFLDYGFDEVILGRPILNRWRIILDPSHKSLGSPELEIQD
jgi:predicted aspartyl protease